MNGYHITRVIWYVVSSYENHLLLTLLHIIADFHVSLCLQRHDAFRQKNTDRPIDQVLYEVRILALLLFAAYVVCAHLSVGRNTPENQVISWRHVAVAPTASVTSSR